RGEKGHTHPARSVWGCERESRSREGDEDEPQRRPAPCACLETHIAFAHRPNRTHGTQRTFPLREGRKSRSDFRGGAHRKRIWPHPEICSAVARLLRTLLLANFDPPSRGGCISAWNRFIDGDGSMRSSGRPLDFR